MSVIATIFYILTPIVGLYVFVGLVIAIVDIVDRRRKGCPQLSRCDAILFVFAWPIVLYYLLKGVNLDNS